jgi:DNA-binding MarR family transcriptional regulator
MEVESMSVPEVGVHPSWKSPLPALLSEVKDRMIGQLHQRIAEEGFDDLRYKHGPVFRFIDEDGCRLTDLAELTGLTKQGIGEVVSELEQLGYVERVPAPDDRRAKIIRLTDRGRKCQAAATRVLGDIEQRWAGRLGDTQLITLRHVLEEIAEEPR